MGDEVRLRAVLRTLSWVGLVFVLGIVGLCVGDRQVRVVGGGVALMATPLLLVGLVGVRQTRARIDSGRGLRPGDPFIREGIDRREAADGEELTPEPPDADSALGDRRAAQRRLSATTGGITVAMVACALALRAAGAHPAWLVAVVACGVVALVVSLIAWSRRMSA